ncbi:MAG: NADH-quinone oxidoreductase subunit J [Candidatus Thalassarchaeaceae archaeon]
MRAITAFTSVGVFIFVLILLQEVNSHSMWDETISVNSPTTLEFADSIFNEWAFATIVLGTLLAMAMIGASYLVRDERLINLVWDIRGEVTDNLENIGTFKKITQVSEQKEEE